MEQTPTQIACATDKELLVMLEKTNYAPYWKELISRELIRRKKND